MTKRQEARRSAMIGSRQFLADNSSVYSGSAGAVDAVNTLDVYLGELDTFLAGQGVDTTGITQDKRNLKNDLAEKIFIVSRGLVAAGNKSNNKELVGKSNFAITRLRKTRDTELVDVAQTIFELGNANIALLTPNNVVQADVDAVKDAKNAYIAKQQKPKSTIAEIKASTVQVNNQFKKIDDFLAGVLDPIITTFKKTHTAFVDGYFAARTIFDVGSSKLGMQISVLDSGTQLGLAKVQVTVNPVQIVKLTTQFGNVRVSSLPTGVYSVVFFKTGFLTQTIEVNHTDGETNILTVQMVES